MNPQPRADRLPPVRQRPYHIFIGLEGAGLDVAGATEIQPQIVSRQPRVCMRKLFLILTLLLTVLLFAGVLSLALWEPEAPRVPMEKVVPNARLQG